MHSLPDRSSHEHQVPARGAIHRVRRITSALAITAWLLTGVLVLLLGFGVYLYQVSLTLPDISEGFDALEIPLTSVVYAADGSVLAVWHGEQDRTYVPLDTIPEDLRNAVVAIEDERFYEHTGVDLAAISRALRVNAEAGSVEQGGSTITQQVVKLLFTDGERSLERKLREALMSLELETRTGKDAVLETYLNLVYFGEGAYGVEAAAERYFDKPVGDLSLAECATLAGLIQAPSRYSPCKDIELAQQRRDVVLAKMAELGYVSAAGRVEAAASPLTIAAECETSPIAPYFTEFVKQALIDELGADQVFEGGLRVYTTINPSLQAMAEAAAFGTLDLEGDPDAAVVCIDHQTGEIVAMVGGRDFAADQYNLASQGRRQPGSAFKTFVLVTALQEGVLPTDRFSAAPYEVQVSDGVWKVQNYGNSTTAGELTLSAATNWSVNAVYARLIMKVGVEDVIATAHEMGITTELEAHPAIALGGLTTGVTPLEMASAYGTIATGGLRVPPIAITRVTDENGVLVWEPDRTSTRALTPEVAQQAAVMLHDVVESGTGAGARISTWAAGKTGTTQQYRDAWFVGYSGRLVTAVWVGHAEGQVEMLNVHGIRVTGGSLPAAIWKRFMEQAVPAAPVPIR